MHRDNTVEIVTADWGCGYSEAGVIIKRGRFDMERELGSLRLVYMFMHHLNMTCHVFPHDRVATASNPSESVGCTYHRSQVSRPFRPLQWSPRLSAVYRYKEKRAISNGCSAGGGGEVGTRPPM